MEENISAEKIKTNQNQMQLEVMNKSFMPENFSLRKHNWNDFNT